MLSLSSSTAGSTTGRIILNEHDTFRVSAAESRIINVSFLFITYELELLMVLFNELSSSLAKNVPARRGSSPGPIAAAFCFMWYLSPEGNSTFDVQVRTSPVGCWSWYNYRSCIGKRNPRSTKGTATNRDSKFLKIIVLTNGFSFLSSQRRKTNLSPHTLLVICTQVQKFPQPTALWLHWRSCLRHLLVFLSTSFYSLSTLVEIHKGETYRGMSKRWNYLT